MSRFVSGGATVSDRLRLAFSQRDLVAFGELLSVDVTWGDPDQPRGCRNRSEVLATMGQLLAKGIDTSVIEMEAGATGVLCELKVEWPTDDPRAWDRRVFQVYVVQEGLIREIRRYDDRESAAEAAGLPK